jgi:aminoglycoside phosphotransferase (APT) family kinase protein
MTMHADERPIDIPLVRRLLRAQFPRWAALPLARVPSAGTDHVLFRLGDGLVLRLPRTPSAVGQVEKEQRWLPALAPHLPLEIPLPVEAGQPGEGYPWPWSVYRWLPGENATLERLADPRQAARALATFIRALQAIDATDGPLPGAHNFGRGVPLITRDEATRAAIAACEGMIDTAAALAAWESALQAPAWDGPPVWIHGDLQAGNLLARDGQLTGVIDFGGLGVGDPACDMMVAWTLFDRASRAAFRETIGVDEATWARGRGWALSFGLIALPYYVVTNPGLAGIARGAVGAVLGEDRRGT